MRGSTKAFVRTWRTSLYLSSMAQSFPRVFAQITPHQRCPLLIPIVRYPMSTRFFDAGFLLSFMTPPSAAKHGFLSCVPFMLAALFVAGHAQAASSPAEMRRGCVDQNKSPVVIEFGRLRNSSKPEDRFLRLADGRMFFYQSEVPAPPDGVIGAVSVYVHRATSQSLNIAFFDPARGAIFRPTDIYWLHGDDSIPRIMRQGMCASEPKSDATMARYARSVTRGPSSSQRR
jgi:hypothetical protein